MGDQKQAHCRKKGAELFGLYLFGCLGSGETGSCNNNQVIKMTDNKRRIGTFIFIILVMAIAREGIAGKQVKLTIGMGKSLFTSALHIAESKGFFRDEGLDVELREFDSGKTALAEMLKQDGPNIAAAAGSPVVFNSFNRTDYAIFAGLSHSDNIEKILARRDKGIKVPTDLKGKKIGVTKGSTGQYFLELFLNFHNLKISDVEIIDIETTSLPRALADGQVDAISSWDPHILNAEEMLGENAHLFPSKGILHDNWFVIAEKDFIKNNQDILVKFLKAVERGNRFLKEHPLESMDIISKRLDIDRMSLISLWGDYEFDLFLDQTISTSLEEQASWVIENKLTNITKIPDYRSYIYTEILDKIRPKRRE